MKLIIKIEMGKRFSRLKYALRAIQDPNTDTGANTPPTGSILYKYNEFATGSDPAEYPRDADSLQGSLDPIGVNPFGLILAATNVVKTNISNRVLTFGSISAVRTAANLETDIANAPLSLSGFVPAKATVFIKDSTQPSTEVTSQITGIKYKPLAGKNYTMPYGQKTGSTVEMTVRANISTAVAAVTGASVSFKSERL